MADMFRKVLARVKLTHPDCFRFAVNGMIQKLFEAFFQTLALLILA